MTIQEEGFKGFFENQDLVVLVDKIAQRYGKLPHEILCDLSLYEFNIDSAVMIKALYAEKNAMEEAQNKSKESAPGSEVPFNTFGLKRKILKESPAKAV